MTSLTSYVIMLFIYLWLLIDTNTRRTFYNMFKIESWIYRKDNYYTCYFDAELDNSTESDIFTHIDGKTNEDVEALAILDIPTPDIPTDDIDQKFRNLVALEIKNCELVEITKEQLKPLKMLKNLWLWDNKILSLPRDLFIHTPSIEILSFANNRIVHISEETLTPLTNLMFADFRGNVNIDSLYTTLEEAVNEKNVVSMETLMEQIKVRCQTRFETYLIANYVKTLWSTRMYADFKIRTDDKEFPVHKCILAVNSPVFEAMFKHEMMEKLHNEMIMNDVSADAVEEFLKFVYLRKAPENSLNAMDLFTIATKYQVNELLEVSEQLILKGLEVDNAFEVFAMGCRVSNMSLKTKAFDFMSTNIFDGDEWPLPPALSEQPDKLKELIDAKHLMEKHKSDAENEFKKVYDDLCGT